MKECFKIMSEYKLALKLFLEGEVHENYIVHKKKEKAV